VARALPVAVVASLTVLAGCSNGKSTPPTTQVTPTSSESAAGALRQAALGMEAASSYRFVGTVSAGGHTVSLSGEFAAPDRLHEVITIAGTPPVERIMIGSTAYQRSGSTWSAARRRPAATRVPPSPRWPRSRP
jgi:hypothetical protein